MNIRPSALKQGQALTGSDLDRVVAIDREHTGQSRRRFFEKCFALAASNPDDFIHIGIARGGSLVGFVMARVLRGEFGRAHAVAVLDALGVDLASQEQGIGQALVEELKEGMRRKGVTSLQTQAAWKDHNLLEFFDTCAFRLAPRLVLERAVAEPLYEASEAV
jgi:ribosomal protein S18 acetylase RimI-like enzyme